MAKDEKGNTYISEAQSKAAGLRDDSQKAKEENRAARQEARAARTDEQQLARLDKLFGKGVGAARERARLSKRIEQRKSQPKKEKSELPSVKEFVDKAREAGHDSLDLKNNSPEEDK